MNKKHFSLLCIGSLALFNTSSYAADNFEEGLIIHALSLRPLWANLKSRIDPQYRQFVRRVSPLSKFAPTNPLEYIQDDLLRSQGVDVDATHKAMIACLDRTIEAAKQRLTKEQLNNIDIKWENRLALCWSLKCIQEITSSQGTKDPFAIHKLYVIARSQGIYRNEIYDALKTVIKDTDYPFNKLEHYKTDPLLDENKQSLNLPSSLEIIVGALNLPENKNDLPLEVLIILNLGLNEGIMRALLERNVDFNQEYAPERSYIGLLFLQHQILKYSWSIDSFYNDFMNKSRPSIH